MRADAPEDQRTHHDFADFRRAHHQCTQMRCIERQRKTPPGSRAPGKLADLAGELSGFLHDDQLFTSQPIGADHFDLAFQQQPDHSLRLTDIEDLLRRREPPRLATGEVARGGNPASIQLRKHLMMAALDQAHMRLATVHSVTPMLSPSPIAAIPHSR